jgi:hypothetical protein
VADWWNTARRRWRTLRALPRDERRASYSAVILLPMVNAALHVAPTHRVRRLLGRLGADPAAETGSLSDEQARRLAHAVGLASRHGVWTGACLQRAIVSWWILRQHGIASEIRFGARKAGDAFLAHAWVEVHGRALDETDEDVRRYTIMPWAPADRGL